MLYKTYGFQKRKQAKYTETARTNNMHYHTWKKTEKKVLCTTSAELRSVQLHRNLSGCTTCAPLGGRGRTRRRYRVPTKGTRREETDNSNLATSEVCATKRKTPPRLFQRKKREAKKTRKLWPCHTKRKSQIQNI